MIVGSLYIYIYLFFVTILTFVYVGKYKSPDYKQSTISSELILVIAMILFIGLRPISASFVDMIAYNQFLEVHSKETFNFEWDTDNKIFDNLEMWWACEGLGLQSFFLLMAAIYFLCAYIGIKRLCPKHTMLAYLVFLGAFSTFGYATNGIKAGAAASIFIMALGYLDKLWVCLPLMLVSLGFHHSMVLPIAAFIVTLFFKNPKWYYYAWFICLIMALLHVTYFQFLFGGMADEHGASYLMASKADSLDVRSGTFRPDFVLYSVVPVVIGFVMEIKRRMKLSKVYTTLIHFYAAANAIWMLCMYASFSNRIAYLSWFVYPIVIILPFLETYNQDNNKYKKIRRATLYHLYFTLFMVLVYYGLFSLGT